mgnify:FL=1
MNTGAWPELKDDLPAHASAAWRRHRGSWTRGLTQRGKPPRDTTARVKKTIKVLVVCITLLVSIGWGLVGAAALIW